MKKLVKLWLLVLGMTILVLSGCGTSAKNEFTENLDSQAKNESYNAAEFTFKFDELSFESASSSSTDSATISMILTQLKDMKLSGDYLLDAKNKAVDYSITVEAVGQKIPLDFIMSEDAIYYSGDSFSQILDVVESFAGDNMPVDLSAAAEEVAGKYVKVTSEDLDSTTGTGIDFSTFTSGAAEGETTLLSEFSKTLDEDSFTKKDDVITHTYDKKELTDFIAYAKENGDKDVKKALEDFDVDEDSLEKVDGLDKLDLTVSINTKTNKATYKVSVNYADDEGNSAKAGITMSVTPKKEDKSVKVPGDADTLSMDDFNELVQSNTGYTLSDEDFNSFYSQLEGVKDSYTKDQIYDMLEGYSLTAAQKAKIDALYE